MKADRGHMTVRIVPLESHEAGDGRVGGTVAERVNLVAILSTAAWTLTCRPLPIYTRNTMPVAFAPLRPATKAD